MFSCKGGIFYGIYDYRKHERESGLYHGAAVKIVPLQ